ncbi:MAG: hypothetical protein CM1200mP41_36000 [Gammaproteobacteria bacterium]|nr:MAG: hypothetical protein CM1200mP41_36000 [Gammaproteobacteria bacterium]
MVLNSTGEPVTTHQRKEYLIELELESSIQATAPGSGVLGLRPEGVSFIY